MTLRILAIGHAYIISNNRAVIREVAKDRGFDITVAAPTFYQGDLRPLYLEPEPPHSELKLVPLNARWTKLAHFFSYDSNQLKWLIRKGNFDIVYAWEEPYIRATFDIVRALRGSNAKLCFRTAQNIYKHYPPPFNYFERAVLKRTQSWIAGGNIIHETMINRGYPPAIGRIIPLGVDTQLYKPLEGASRNQILSKLGLTRPMMGFVGRLVPEKGIKLLLQAFEKAKKPELWGLLFLGSGPLRKYIMDWAKKNSWDERVKVQLVDHADIPLYLASLDFICAPSQTTKKWREQFGRMIIEAFACGVPIASSNSGEIPYVIKDAGLIVDETDVEGWAKTIERLFFDEALRKKLAALGRERSTLYSATYLANEYRTFYQWLSGV